MASVVVSYPKHEGAKFDADYYRDTHIPLVEKTWTSHGMTGVRILWPADADQPNAAMVVLDFKDGASIDAALGDPATGAVMEDIANFTDIHPAIYRAD